MSASVSPARAGPAGACVADAWAAGVAPAYGLPPQPALATASAASTAAATMVMGMRRIGHLLGRYLARVLAMPRGRHQPAGTLRPAGEVKGNPRSGGIP